MPARSHSGPPPDPNALRRDRRDDSPWSDLPPEREGDPPAWPLTSSSARERQLWSEEWCRPQAVMWERSGQEREVALYVRALAVAERPKATVASRSLVRLYMEELGISQSGLRRNRWRIAAEAPSARLRATGTDAPSAKARLEVLK